MPTLPPFPERAPSLETLRAAFPHLAEPTLRTVREIMRGAVPPEDVSDRCNRWASSCYHRPSWTERALVALDDLMGTYGIEHVYAAGHGPSTYPPRIRFRYLNTGDSYAPTIIRADGAWRIGSWGDTVETMERRGLRCE